VTTTYTTRTYTTRPGDVLDRIVWVQAGRPAWGRMRGLVEAAIRANPHLRHHGPVLPAGLTLTLPDLSAPTLPAPVVKLWD
jgi:phage tail protein X